MAPGSAELRDHDDAAFSLAAAHAFVGFVHFVEGIFLDHQVDAGQFGESQGVFGVRGDSRGPALEAFAPKRSFVGGTSRGPWRMRT